MAKKKKHNVEKFANDAHRIGSDYAKAQMKETVERMAPIRVPEGYTKIGDRLKDKTGN